MEQEDEFLSQDEVDALLNGIGEASTASNVLQNPSGDIRPYAGIIWANHGWRFWKISMKNSPVPCA
jgi:hypothetical protein